MEGRSLVKIKRHLLVDTPSLHSTLRPHHTPSKELAHNAKPVLGALELSLEKIMLVRRFYLPPSNSPYCGILRGTDRTFSIFPNLVQAPLVKGMLAQKVNRRKIERAST